MSPSDAEIVAQIRSGRPNAFRTIVERYWPGIRALVRRSIRDTGKQEDLCQETFLRAFTKIHQYDPVRPFGPWIAKIGFNLVLEHLRTRGNEAVGIPFPESIPIANAELPDRVAIERLTFDEYLDRLPLFLRIVFCLKHGLMLTIDEIAEVLGEPPGTVKASLFKAREHLKGLHHHDGTGQQSTGRREA